MKIISVILVCFSGAVAAYGQSVAQGGVVNGASFAKGQPVAPGSLVSIFGTNLASTTASAASVPLSTTLGGVNVTFNNVPAPLIFVSHSAANGDQINAQLPFELAGSSTAQVVVSNNGVASPPQTIQLGAVEPGIFAIGTQAVAYGNTDAAFAWPVGSIPGVTSHPAKIGDPQTLAILATGLGPVNPPVQTGSGASDGVLHTTTTQPTVLIGNVPAQVVFSGMSPQFPGVYQLNVIVQPGTPTGDAIPLQIKMGDAPTTASITIAVSN